MCGVNDALVGAPCQRRRRDGRRTGFLLAPCRTACSGRAQIASARPLPLGGAELDQFAARASELRGAVVVVDLSLAVVRHRVIQPVARELASVIRCRSTPERSTSLSAWRSVGPTPRPSSPGVADEGGSSASSAASAPSAGSSLRHRRLHHAAHLQGRKALLSSARGVVLVDLQALVLGAERTAHVRLAQRPVGRRSRPLRQISQYSSGLHRQRAPADLEFEITTPACTTSPGAICRSGARVMHDPRYMRVWSARPTRTVRQTQLQDGQHALGRSKLSSRR